MPLGFDISMLAGLSRSLSVPHECTCILYNLSPAPIITLSSALQRSISPVYHHAIRLVSKGQRKKKTQPRRTVRTAVGPL